jgi:hypothetical protein
VLKLLLFSFSGKCPAGQFSYDGYLPCRLCPRNYYQEQVGATSCVKCAADRYTSSAGSSNLTNCIDATGTKEF